MYFKDMELLTIELNKFLNDPKAQLKDVLKKAKTALDRWVAFLARHDLLDRPDLPSPLNGPQRHQPHKVDDVEGLL